MAATATVVGGEMVLGGSERRWGAASRRKGLGVALVFAVGAATAGAALGLLAQPDPQHERELEHLAYAASAAQAAAQASEAKTHALQKALASAQSRIEQLSAVGAVQELADYQEAEKLGVERYMSRSQTALWGDERRHAMAAIVREARRNGLDPLLVAAVIQVESHFNPYAVSGVGACGLMQLMPPTAQSLLPGDAKDTELRPQHLFNPVLNIELGTAYLAQLMRRFDGDLSMALIAYNAGPTVARSLVRNSPASKRLSVYPKAVLAAYRQLVEGQHQLELASR